MKIEQACASLTDHFPKYLEDLKSLVRIPSVSFSGFPPEEVRRSAQAVAGMLKEHGLENVEILEIPGAHPYVYGDWLHAPGAPTLLLYAHHDVQPPGRVELWKSPPFEPTVRPGPGGERLYARGSADDKAGILVQTAAIHSWLKATGSLPVNVKVVIEGEEEIGSSHLSQFLKEYHSRLQADVLVLTDSANFDCGIPALTVALRGLVAVGVEVRALNKTIHSGMWGGPIPDPVVALSKMLAGLVDDEGRITIPGMLDQVRPLTAREEEEFRKIPFDEKAFRAQSGMVPGAKLFKKGGTPLVQLWRQPSLTVTAIQASSRAQAGNIINDAAWAKVTVRLVADMDPERSITLLEEYLKARVPWGLEVKLTREACSGAWMTESTGPAFEAADAALMKGYGHAPYKIGMGGSIPFVAPFAEALGGAPALLIGVEDPYTDAHGENESLLLDDFKKAILGQIHLFSEIAARWKTK